MPDLIAEQPRRQALIGWLGEAAIGAVIMNPKSAGTYSYYTAEHHGAAGSTVELGRIGTLGQNDLSQFADVVGGAGAAAARRAGGREGRSRTCSRWRRRSSSCPTRSRWRSGATRRTSRRSKQGEVIATDGDTVYTVQHDEELVVFPNPDVRVGLRAGLMVVRVD